jgi:uncharacterized protein
LIKLGNFCTGRNFQGHLNSQFNHRSELDLSFKMSIIPGSNLSSEAHARLDHFGSTNMAIFDESHNWQHILNVYANMLAIVKGDQIEYEEDLLTYMIKLHDIRDHKYPNCITEAALISFLDAEVGQVKREQIMLVIDNVSFSKQDSGKCTKISDSKLVKYLTIVRDADRLEALGQVGIQRCITFQTLQGNRVPQIVLFHCHEKILRLLPEKFIINPTAQKMAEPKHQEVVNYVKANCLIDSEEACRRGRIQDLKWLLDHDCSLSSNCFEIANQAKHNKLCEWLIVNGMLQTKLITIAVKTDNYDLMIFALDNEKLINQLYPKYNFNADLECALSMAIFTNSEDTAFLLHNRGARLSNSEIEFLSTHCNLKGIQIMMNLGYNVTYTDNMLDVLRQAVN